VTHWPETEVQDVDPGVEYDPGAQALHEEAPVFEEKVFREQFEHVEDPVRENVPAWQAVGVPYPPEQYEPAGQAVHFIEITFPLPIFTRL
jgi:hypothetical protein